MIAMMRSLNELVSPTEQLSATCVSITWGTNIDLILCEAGCDLLYGSTCRKQLSNLNILGVCLREVQLWFLCFVFYREKFEEGTLHYINTEHCVCKYRNNVAQ